MSSIIIGRPINGVSLNGDEYLLDENEDFMEFDSQEKAMEFLKDNGHEDWSDEELMDAYNFKDRYPYDDGDVYWTTVPHEDEEYEDNSGFYNNGIIAIAHKWDDASKAEYDKGDMPTYYNSLDDVLWNSRDTYQFVQVRCKFSDVELFYTNDGEYMVYDEETGKYFQSY